MILWMEIQIIMSVIFKSDFKVQPLLFHKMTDRLTRCQQTIGAITSIGTALRSIFDDQSNTFFPNMPADILRPLSSIYGQYSLKSKDSDHDMIRTRRIILVTLITYYCPEETETQRNSSGQPSNNGRRLLADQGIHPMN